MGKEKFTYNAQTLQYEKVKEPLGVKLVRIFSFLCTAALTAFLFTLILHRYFPSPREKALLSEIEVLKAEYQELDGVVSIFKKELEHLRKRDSYAHRMVFGMDPIDEGVWEGGVGGHDQYGEYLELKNSGSLIATTKQKVDKLKRQMVMQSKSLDTIINMAMEKEKMYASIPSIKPVRSDKLKRHTRLLSGFGWRIHPIYKVPKFHHGIDFSAPTGTPIQATGDGVVVRANTSASFGKVVEVDHGYGYKTRYAHMNKISVKKGQAVKRGQELGLIGNTGRSKGAHLHYEIHFKGKPIDPINHCLDGLSPQEYEQLVNAAQVVNQSFDYHLEESN